MDEFHVATCAALNLFVSKQMVNWNLLQKKKNSLPEHKPVFDQYANSIIEQSIPKMPSLTQHQAMMILVNSKGEDTQCSYSHSFEHC